MGPLRLVPERFHIRIDIGVAVPIYGIAYLRKGRMARVSF